jgi:hypothetical protein
LFFSGLDFEGEVWIGSVERGSLKSKLLNFFSELMLFPEHELNMFVLGDRLLMEL